LQSSIEATRIEDDRAAAEAVYQRQVWGDLRRNYIAHVFHGLGGQTGFRLLNAPTFLPAYLELLAGVQWVVNLAVGLQSIGAALSPLLGATLIEHRRRVLPMGFLTGGAMRLQILLIALAGFLLPPSIALVAICVCLGLFGFFQGIQGVIFNYLMSKTIPVERRGVLTGLRNALAGGTVVGVAYLGGQLVESEAFGNGYATTFMLAFLLTSLGLLALAFVREPEPPDVRPRSELLRRLAEVPALLRADGDFAAYLVARSLATAGRIGVPLYVLYAKEQVAIGGAELATLTIVFSLAQSASNFLWGVIADRLGFRAVFLGSVGLWLASVVALLATTEAAGLAGVAVCFGGVGAGLGGFMMGSQSLVLEFGDRADLPLRIAAANTTSELMGGLVMLAGAAVATVAPLSVILVAGVVLKIGAMVVIAVRVREPRTRARTQR
jgi:MFS family permease